MSHESIHAPFYPVLGLLYCTVCPNGVCSLISSPSDSIFKIQIMHFSSNAHWWMTVVLKRKYICAKIWIKDCLVLYTCNILCLACSVVGIIGTFLPRQIYQNTVNINATFFTGSEEFPTKLKKFFEQQDSWMRSMIQNESDTFWNGISLILSQFDGLVDGYNANPYQGKVQYCTIRQIDNNIFVISI